MTDHEPLPNDARSQSETIGVILLTAVVVVVVSMTGMFYLSSVDSTGDEVRFSVVRLGGLSPDAQRRSRELDEARYDLVGAHYLATGHPPGSQS